MGAERSKKETQTTGIQPIQPTLSSVNVVLQKTQRELDDVKGAIDRVLAVAITDPSGVITYVNDRFCNLYQYSKTEIIGNTHRLLKSGEHPPSFYQKMWNTITQGKTFEGEIKNRAKDGSYHWAYIVIVPFLGNDGKPVQYVSFRTDITPAKDAEFEKSKLQKSELAAATAQAAVQARDRFVSMAAHELKTPITSLQMVLDLLVREVKNSERPKDLQRLLSIAAFQTLRLTSIINDLLDVSRFSAGKLVLKLDLVDLGALVKNLITHSHPDLCAAGCKVKLDIQNNVKGVWDQARIEQVVINLLSNAMKYGQKKPIYITVTGNDESAKLVIEDHGIGIPQDFQQRLFQRFERSDTALHYKGIGLGLWITNQIVDAHRGQIHVKSVEGQGSTFTVELPIREQTPWTDTPDEYKRRLT